MSNVSKPISLLNNDPWINEAIDNLRYLGDVGETDLNLLENILPHCTLDQLMHIERSSKGRDLSPVTNKLWKGFYERKFGKDDVATVVERIQRRKESFKWMDLYVAKMEALENKAKIIEDRLVQIYQKEKARKQSRQIIFCGNEVSSSINMKPRSERKIEFDYNTSKSKVLKKTKAQVCMTPPSNDKKRSFERAVGSRKSSNKSKILKKAKRETFKSIEMKNLIAYRRNAVQKW